MIPVAVFAQNIGADKNWDDATSTVKLKKDTVTVLLTTGDNKLYKNDKAEEMDTTAVINDGRMFIPVRFAAEAFDYKVDFKNSTITLSSNGLNSAKDTLGLSLKLMPYMPKDQNYMISPISLKLALAMAANAADGETKKQMLDTLGISDLSTYNDYADKLIKNYAGSSDSDMTIDIANSIWLNEDKFKDYSGMAFADPFKNIVKTFFHGEAATVNNNNAVNTINNWVSDKTRGKIKDLLSDSAFDSMLVNTVYFKGKWYKPFNKESTHKQDFTDNNGAVKQTDFMHNTDNYEYYEDDSAQVLAKPYTDMNIAMFFILPKTNRSLSNSELYQMMNGIDDKLIIKNVVFSMPKFTTKFKLDDMSGIFSNLGMSKAFLDSAEFPNLYNQPYKSCIGDIVHETYISVDEEQTEAAAAAGISYGCANPEETMTLDHPFYYFIKDKTNGEILFMGEYAFVDGD